MNNQNEKFVIFGGYILTGGILKDKNTGETKPWRGITVLLAETVSGQFPMKAEAFKCVYSDGLAERLGKLSPGECVSLDWSLSLSNGQPRIADVRPIAKNGK